MTFDHDKLKASLAEWKVRDAAEEVLAEPALHGSTWIFMRLEPWAEQWFDAYWNK